MKTMDDTHVENQVVPTSIDELIAQIEKGIIDPKTLDLEQRREIVDHLRVIYETQDQIAALLKISKQLLSNDIKQIQKKHALTLISGGPLLVIGRYLDAARVAGDAARKQGDIGLYWKVNHDTFTSLQKLGLVPNAPEQEKDKDEPAEDLRLSRKGNFTESALQLADRIQQTYQPKP